MDEFKKSARKSVLLVTEIQRKGQKENVSGQLAWHLLDEESTRNESGCGRMRMLRWMMRKTSKCRMKKDAIREMATLSGRMQRGRPKRR